MNETFKIIYKQKSFNYLLIKIYYKIHYTYIL